MISEDTQTAVSDSLTGSIDHAEGVGDSVTSLAD
jgi:hypothetical protein